MRHQITESEDELTISYQWKQDHKWNSIAAKVSDTAQEMIPGSEEEFIAEHYWGYSKYNDTTTFEYNVQHPPWKIFPVKNYLIDCDFGALYGDEFSIFKDTVPNSVFVAQGQQSLF